MARENNIGENTKRYRNKLGTLQDNLSKKANLTFHTIAKIKSGAIPNPLLKRLKKSQTYLVSRSIDLMK